MPSLITQGGGYALAAGPGQLDAAQFERLSAAGREALERGEAAVAAGRFREALALWRGRALADVAEVEPLAREAARLEELRLVANEGRIEADLALGLAAELTGELETLVAEYPGAGAAVAAACAGVVPGRAAGRCAGRLPAGAGDAGRGAGDRAGRGAARAGAGGAAARGSGRGAAPGAAQPAGAADQFCGAGGGAGRGGRAGRPGAAGHADRSRRGREDPAGPGVRRRCGGPVPRWGVAGRAWPASPTPRWCRRW